MTDAAEHFARELAYSRSELERRSLQVFIERERRLVNLDITDLQDRYSVRTARHLSSRIATKAVYSHPAWEEMIEWERLETYLERLNNWQAELS
jgi:hypothetical protein